MGSLAVWAVVDVDVRCLLLLHPNAAETEGHKTVTHRFGPTPTPTTHQAMAESLLTVWGQRPDGAGLGRDCGPWETE